MDFKGGEILFFFGLLFCWRWGDSFDLLVWGIGGIVDILHDGWDSWGEWERRVGEYESGTLVRWRGGEGKGREDGDDRRRWNGVCVYDCTDVNEYTRFTIEKE